VAEIKKYKPTSPGRRFMTISTFDEITTDKPEKSLTVGLKKRGGRNNQGKLTVRHQGGGSKRKSRIIDFRKQQRFLALNMILIVQHGLLYSNTMMEKRDTFYVRQI